MSKLQIVDQSIFLFSYKWKPYQNWDQNCKFHPPILPHPLKKPQTPKLPNEHTKKAPKKTLLQKNKDHEDK